jgi:hypothetical protein
MASPAIALPGIIRGLSRLVCALLVFATLFGLLHAPDQALARNPYNYQINTEGDPGDGVLKPRENPADPEPKPELTPEFEYLSLPLWIGPSSVPVIHLWPGPGSSGWPLDSGFGLLYRILPAVEGRCQHAP